MPLPWRVPQSGSGSPRPAALKAGGPNVPPNRPVRRAVRLPLTSPVAGAIGALALLTLLAGAFVAAPATSVGSRSRLADTPSGAVASGSAEPAALSLRRASTEYFVGGPGDPVIELRITVANDDGHGRNTDSTSILWEPSFVQHTVFLHSDPPAWRVRVDEHGWGVMDTAGVLGRRRGTFRLWFVGADATVYEPRVRVVANGHVVIAEAAATASHRRRAEPSPLQTMFEHGPLALAADAAVALPSDARGVFPFATGIGVLLTAAAASGGLAAFRLASRRPEQRRAPAGLTRGDAKTSTSRPVEPTAARGAVGQATVG